MPTAAIRSELPPRLNSRRYFELKGRWGVSMAALIRRARDLDVIADTAYRRAMIELGRKGWRMRGMGNGAEALESDPTFCRAGKPTWARSEAQMD